MKIRSMFSAAAMLAGVTLALPVSAQAQEEAPKVQAVPAAEATPAMEMKTKGGMESCQCPCMEAHAEIIKAHTQMSGGAETPAEGTEAHAAMMKAHAEMMAEGGMDGCKCMAHGESAEGMQCQMHGMQHGEGEMKDHPGMQHQHGQTDAESPAEADEG